MIYGESYFLERVKQNNYGRIDIFEGHINTHQGNVIFQTMREEDADKMALRVEQFCKDSTGDFTVFMRSRHNQAWSSAEVLKLHLTRQLSVIAERQGTAETYDIESIVNQRLTTILEEDRRRKEIDEIKAENDRLKQPMERVTFILERVLERFVPNEPAARPINGTQADDINKAVAVLIRLFDEEGVIMLADKLRNDPEAVKFVRNYAGI